MKTIFNFVISNMDLNRKCIQTSSVFFANKKKKEPVIFKTKSKKPVIEISKTMSVSELSLLMDRAPEQIIEAALFTNSQAPILKKNSIITNTQLVQQIVERCGYKYKWKMVIEEPKLKEFSMERLPPDPLKMVKRPPVVTIMGHVDHGKTTLLDNLRHSNIVSQEFGGITQHIGAFSVKLSTGEVITFIDTPGHAAFAAMRARGAMVTDLVVLVVAADDGIMKQTVESIRYAQEANVPIIVAINKIDKPEADAERTMKEFLQHGIQLEAFGGDIQCVPISALKGVNLKELQDCILAQAELLDLKADPTGLVEAACIESKTDASRGKLSTALIQRGTLKKSTILVAGSAWAKVRAMFDDKGQPMMEAKPGFPVEILGWRKLPSAGEKILQVDTEHQAKKLIGHYMVEEMARKVADDSIEIDSKRSEHQAIYDELRKKKLELGYRGGRTFRPSKQKEYTEKTGPELSIVLKGDVDGSVEAILDILDSYTSDQCRLNLLSYGVGPINEGDIEMAKIFNGVVYGFNVKVADKLSTEGISIQQFNVIYHLIADIKQSITNRLPPLEVEEIIGEANVLADFTVTDGKKKIFVAGCRCTKGTLNKKKQFKLIKNDEVILKGDLQSLKHFKNEVEVIKNDVECGLSFEDQSVQPTAGDTIVCFQYTHHKQKLNWDLDFL